MTIMEATRKWVGEFNAINHSLIAKAFKDNIDDWIEHTKPTVGDHVWSNELQVSLEVEEIDYDEEKVTLIEYESGVRNTVDIDDVHIEHDSWLPMWGTLWTFGERLDEEWALDNLDIMSQCGFRIFEDDETGDVYFGIDGAGYDFYEAHWIPLYKARGLRWHNKEETV